MNDLEIKEAFEKLDSEASAIDSKMIVLHREMRAIETRMFNLEKQWLETHECSCELLGLECEGHE